MPPPPPLLAVVVLLLEVAVLSFLSSLFHLTTRKDMNPVIFPFHLNCDSEMPVRDCVFGSANTQIIFV